MLMLMRRQLLSRRYGSRHPLAASAFIPPFPSSASLRLQRLDSYILRRSYSYISQSTSSSGVQKPTHRSILLPISGLPSTLSISSLRNPSSLFESLITRNYAAQSSTQSSHKKRLTRNPASFSPRVRRAKVWIVSLGVLFILVSIMSSMINRKPGELPPDIQELYDLSLKLVSDADSASNEENKQKYLKAARRILRQLIYRLKVDDPLDLYEGLPDEWSLDSSSVSAVFPGVILSALGEICVALGEEYFGEAELYLHRAMERFIDIHSFENDLRPKSYIEAPDAPENQHLARTMDVNFIQCLELLAKMYEKEERWEDLEIVSNRALHSILKMREDDFRWHTSTVGRRYQNQWEKYEQQRADGLNVAKPPYDFKTLEKSYDEDHISKLSEYLSTSYRNRHDARNAMNYGLASLQGLVIAASSKPAVHEMLEDVWKVLPSFVTQLADNEVRYLDDSELDDEDFDRLIRIHGVLAALSTDFYALSLDSEEADIPEDMNITKDGEAITQASVLLFEKLAKSFCDSHQNSYEMKPTQMLARSMHKKRTNDHFDDSDGNDIPIALTQLVSLPKNIPQRDTLLGNAAIAYLNSARLAEREGNVKLAETNRSVANFAAEECKTIAIRGKLETLADTES